MRPNTTHGALGELASRTPHRHLSLRNEWGGHLIAAAPSRPGAGAYEAQDGSKSWDGRKRRGIGLGGILVIVGIVVMIVWSFLIGLIIALIGLIAFDGFAKGKWY